MLQLCSLLDPCNDEWDGFDMNDAGLRLLSLKLEPVEKWTSSFVS